MTFVETIGRWTCYAMKLQLLPVKLLSRYDSIESVSDITIRTIEYIRSGVLQTSTEGGVDVFRRSTLDMLLYIVYAPGYHLYD